VMGFAFISLSSLFFGITNVASLIETLSHKVFFEPSLLNVTYKPNNQTHYGRILIDFYQDIPSIYVRILLSSQGKSYIDQTINFCKWQKNPRIDFLVTYFEEQYKKVVNPKLLQCPIKKGFYLAVGARLISLEASGLFNVPSFIPIKGTFNFSKIMKTKISGKIQPFYMTSQIIRFA
jgi:hypothetical protein